MISAVRLTLEWKEDRSVFDAGRWWNGMDMGVALRKMHAKGAGIGLTCDPGAILNEEMAPPCPGKFEMTAMSPGMRA